MTSVVSLAWDLYLKKLASHPLQTKIATGKCLSAQPRRSDAAAAARRLSPAMYRTPSNVISRIYRLIN
jgi:hypothetical protein